jgi:hypothetical protein
MKSSAKTEACVESRQFSRIIATSVLLGSQERSRIKTERSRGRSIVPPAPPFPKGLQFGAKG